VYDIFMVVQDVSDKSRKEGCNAIVFNDDKLSQSCFPLLLPERRYFVELKSGRRINVRVDEKTYRLLQTMAGKRGENISQVVRRILKQSLENEIAVDAQDVLVLAVRKAIVREIRHIEKRLANLASKTAITSASTENLALRILVLLNEPDFAGVRQACRKRGVAFVREDLDRIMKAYEGEDEN